MNETNVLNNFNFSIMYRVILSTNRKKKKKNILTYPFQIRDEEKLGEKYFPRLRRETITARKLKFYHEQTWKNICKAIKFQREM